MFLFFLFRELFYFVGRVAHYAKEDSASRVFTILIPLICQINHIIYQFKGLFYIFIAGLHFFCLLKNFEVLLDIVMLWWKKTK